METTPHARISICPRCGAPNPEQADFCMACAHSLTGKPPAPPLPSAERSSPALRTAQGETSLSPRRQAAAAAATATPPPMPADATMVAPGADAVASRAAPADDSTVVLPVPLARQPVSAPAVPDERTLVLPTAAGRPPLAPAPPGERTQALSPDDQSTVRLPAGGETPLGGVPDESDDRTVMLPATAVPSGAEPAGDDDRTVMLPAGSSRATPSRGTPFGRGTPTRGPSPLASRMSVLSSLADVDAPNLLAEGLEIAGRYLVKGLIGKGGMGVVYLVHDEELDRDVALKVIRSDIAASPETLERFKREIQLSSKVTHRNVLRVYDLGESEGVKFLTMEYVQGEDLSDVVKRDGRLPFDRVMNYFQQICAGLGVAHEQGVIHRDLKPQNVMIDPTDRVLLTDFGLATVAESSSAAKSGAIMGTPYYMSPEQVRGEELDQRSDIYALGVMLYEQLTGAIPFAGGSVLDVMKRRLTDKPRPIGELNPDLPAYIRRVIDKCLATDREQRYASCEEIVKDIYDATEGRRRRRQTAAVMSLAAFLVIGAVGASGWYVYQQKQAAAAANRAPVSVLIADFENNTGETVFDNSLEPTFQTALEGASFITSYNRTDAGSLVARLRPERAVLDETGARLVAAREGISMVTAGSVTRQGQGYAINVRTVDPATGRTLYSDNRDVARKDEVLATLAKLATGVRRALGDVTPASAQAAAAETFTAASLEAAHAYATAQRLQEAGKWNEAIAEYEKTIQLDPGFGRAYAGLAVINFNQGRQDEAESQYKLAMARVGRMSDREKYRTRGGYYLITRQPDKAIEELTVLVKQYPADTSGLSNLAVAYYLKRDMKRALEYGRRAVAIYPKDVPLRNNVGLFAMYAGQFDTAIDEQKTCIRMDKGFTLAYIGKALSELAKGDIGSARATWASLSTVSREGASAAAMGLADLALYEGRPAEARALLQKTIESDLAAKDSDSAARKLTTLGEVFALEGNRAQAVAAVDRARSLSVSAAITFSAGRVLNDAGDHRRALGVAAELDSRLEPEPQLYARLLRGEVAVTQGNARRAVEEFTQANKSMDSWLGHFGLGRAYLEAGLIPEAHAEFDTCLRQRGLSTALLIDEVPTFRAFPSVHYYLGRTFEALGSADAASAYRTFISIKENGTDPLLSDAQRRLATLQPSVTSGSSGS